MCGIAGILSLDADREVDPEALQTMAAQLVHRGPDDAGSYIESDNQAGLAFRRLAIIDLQTGNQPIANEDESVRVVFNGEIYNYRELRRDLQARGHVFRTQTDTEVIVHLYEEYGAACFEYLAGMFAIAIWDSRTGQLTLARDRFGQKPLTYAAHDGRLYFASEAKALLALPEIQPQLNPQALHAYLLLQYVPAPVSIYNGFQKLPPAHLLTAHAHQPLTPVSEPYWTLPDEPFLGTYDEARTLLTDKLTTAVEKRLISDVPLGAFLSGGIDSSIVVGLMRKLGVSPLRTFSIGFPDARYDETAHARRVARHFDTEHHEHIVTPEAREVLDTLAFHYDEPFADSSAIPTYYVSQWTRQSVTVALTGDAGDELFAGYDRYRAAQLAARFDRWPRSVRRGIAALAGWLPHNNPKTWTNRAYRFAEALAATPAQRYFSWIRIFSPTLLAAGYRREFADRIEPERQLQWFDALYAARPGAPAERAMHTDLHSYLPYDLLTKVDIASMACSLECRAPFLDHELAGFAANLPLDFKLDAGGSKRILKDLARDLLPAEILQRSKMGFGVPIGAWFRAELREDLRAALLDADGICGQVFERAWLADLVERHIAGRANFEHPLWALFMLDRWYRRWHPSF